MPQWWLTLWTLLSATRWMSGIKPELGLWSLFSQCWEKSSFGKVWEPLEQKNTFVFCVKSFELCHHLLPETEHCRANVFIYKIFWSTHLAARLSRHFKGGLESAALLCGQDSSRPFWTLVLFSIINTLSSTGPDTTILIFAFHFGGQTEETIAKAKVLMNRLSHI